MKSFLRDKFGCIYSKMSLLRPVFPSPKWYFSYDIIFDIKTTSLIRPLLGSQIGGLNIGILLYISCSIIKCLNLVDIVYEIRVMLQKI